MNKLALAAGTLLTVFGVVLFSVVSWDCAHPRPIGPSCPNPDPILVLVILPLIATGLVLIAYPLLTPRRRLPRTARPRTGPPGTEEAAWHA